MKHWCPWRVPFLVHLHFGDHALSVIRLLLTFHISDFSSETAERNSTKLDRKQDLIVIYKVYVFLGPNRKTRLPPRPLIGWDILISLKPLNRIQRNFTGSKISTSSTKLVFFGPIGKNKMAAPASDWLRHFRLLFWNRWTEFNKTWQEARSQCPLPSLCLSGWSEKQDGRPGLSLAETILTSLKPPNGIQQILTGSKISKSSNKFVWLCNVPHNNSIIFWHLEMILHTCVALLILGLRGQRSRSDYVFELCIVSAQ